MATRILVVDDSLVVGRQLGSILAAHDDFEIVGHARNGAEALKAYSDKEPDVVMMDIVMPMMDGLQALRAIIGMDAGARVIMLSSIGGVGERATEALRMGAKAVVAKPFEPDEVVKIINSVLAEDT